MDQDTDAAAQQAIKDRLAAECAARLLAAQERNQRLRQMTPEELFRLDRQEKRARRQSRVGDQDLVAMALAKPKSLDRQLQDALLNAPLREGDETKFARTLPGCRLTGLSRFDICAALPHLVPLALSTPVACKFMLCDMRVTSALYIDEGDLDPVARVEAAYQEQLRLEREDAPLERARELVRSPELKVSRLNARAMLREFEAAAEQGDGTEVSAEAIWARIGPKFPVWVMDIAEGGEDYGFAILTTREAAARRQALERWKGIFYEEDRWDNLSGFKSATHEVFGGYHLLPRMNRLWIGSDDNGPSEHRPNDLRAMFKTGNEVLVTLPNERYLRNTFLVLAGDCIPSELDTKKIVRDEDFDNPELAPPTMHPETEISHGYQLPTNFLWAYDADWTPPGGEDGAQADEDGYQGRVKVSLHSVLTWFYYARLTGVDMKALWRRSLELEDQVWTCKDDVLRPGNPERLI